MKKLSKKSWIIFVISIIIAAAFLFLFYYFKFEWVLTEGKSQEVDYLYYTLIITLTIIVIFLACEKSDNALSQSRTNYLIKIDERWSSREIIKARIIIHKMYINTKTTHPLKNNYCHDYDKFIESKLSEEINMLSEAKEENKIEEFVYLLNFLDFLETIGYLESKNKIGLTEIEELLGNSIKFHFKIFENYIYNRRKEHKNNEFYLCIESLYYKIKEPRKRKKCNLKNIYS